MAGQCEWVETLEEANFLVKEFFSEPAQFSIIIEGSGEVGGGDLGIVHHKRGNSKSCLFCGETNAGSGEGGVQSATPLS
jgi:hypothetical protein